MTEVDDLLDNKANVSYVDLAVFLKASLSCVNDQLDLKNKTSPPHIQNTEVDNLLTPKAIKADVDIELAKKANVSDMAMALSQKHPLMTATSDLTINRLYTRPWSHQPVQHLSNSGHIPFHSVLQLTHQ